MRFTKSYSKELEYTKSWLRQLDLNFIIEEIENQIEHIRMLKENGQENNLKLLIESSETYEYANKYLDYTKSNKFIICAYLSLLKNFLQNISANDDESIINDFNEILAERKLKGVRIEYWDGDRIRTSDINEIFKEDYGDEIQTIEKYITNILSEGKHKGPQK